MSVMLVQHTCLALNNPANAVVRIRDLHGFTRSTRLSARRRIGTGVHGRPDSFEQSNVTCATSKRYGE